MRRRPYLEREEMLQLVLVGAALVDEELRSSLVAAEFSEPYATVINAIQGGKDVTPDLVETVHTFAESHLGVLRESRRERLIEACVRRLRVDAVYREASKRDTLAATFVRMSELIQERKRNGTEEPEQRQEGRA